MSIKNIIPNIDGKIIQIEYKYNDFQKKIEPKILTVSSPIDKKNVGTILEHYLLLSAEANNYFEDNKSVIYNFINRYSLNFENFIPDCIICIFPADVNRKQLLQAFKDKITINYSNRNEIDRSENFVKIDPSKSIKKHHLTKDDYKLSIDLQKPIKGLLIIDDVIDEGSTLNILLEMLLDKNLINENTIINMACIYNRPKKQKSAVNHLEAFKARLNIEKDNSNIKPD